MKTTQLEIIEDGIKYNIEDARNTIAQIKAYLICIYELLVKSLDQLIKLTSDTDDTSDFNNEHLESVIVVINAYIQEIKNIVSNAQYNGRKLLADTYSTDKSIIFRLTNNVICNGSINNKFNDFTITLPVVGTHALGIESFESDFSNIFEL